MARIAGKGHEALRRGRWSADGAEYFLTISTRQRHCGLSEPDQLRAIFAQLKQLESDQNWHVRTAAVMPDHLHLLVILGESEELASVVRLFKGRLCVKLRAVGVRWERGYFDHRMRPDEDRLPVFRYIFLNPYRAGLAQMNQKWPGYFCANDDWAWFGPLTDEACPHPEWLMERQIAG